MTFLEAIQKLRPSMVLAFDPGNLESGWMLCEKDSSLVGHLRIYAFGNAPNETILAGLRTTRGKHKCQLVTECPRPQGQLMGAEAMETLVVIGRITEVWEGPWSYAFRVSVKTHVTGSAAAKDKHVLLALKDRFGGESVAVGGKRCQKCKGTGMCGGKKNPKNCSCLSGWLVPPGPLYGVATHIWQALAVACWWVDAGQEQHRIAGLQPTS